MTVRKPPEHGTNSGYQAHVKRGETPCQPCRDAHTAYQSRWKRDRTAEFRRLRAEISELREGM